MAHTLSPHVYASLQGEGMRAQFRFPTLIATVRDVAPLVLYRFVMVGTLMWMKDQEEQSARRRYAHNRRMNVPALPIECASITCGLSPTCSGTCGS